MNLRLAVHFFASVNPLQSCRIAGNLQLRNFGLLFLFLQSCVSLPKSKPEGDKARSVTFTTLQQKPSDLEKKPHAAANQSRDLMAGAKNTLLQVERSSALLIIQLAQPVMDNHEQQLMKKASDFLRFGGEKKGNPLPDRDLKKQAQEFEERLNAILSADLSDRQLQMLLAQAQVNLAVWLVDRGEYDQSQQVSKTVLNKQNISVQTYRWALSAWMIAESLKTSSDYPRNFGELQRSHCSKLCDSPGWKAVSLYDSVSFTFAGYGNRLLSEPQFVLAGAKRPVYLQSIFNQKFLVRATEEKKVEPLTSSKNSFKQQNPKPVENPISSCGPLRLMIEHFLESSEVKHFSLKTPDLTAIAVSLDKSPCRASDLNLAEEDYLQIQFEVFLGLSANLWQQRSLVDAAQWGQLALQKAELLQETSYVYEAAEVLYGNLGYEQKKRQDLLQDLTQLEQRSSSYADSDLKKWMNWRIALLNFEQGNYSTALNRFGALKDLAESAGEIAKYSFWLARSLLALNKTDTAESHLRFAGSADPLGYYDATAAQLSRTFASEGSAQIYTSTPRQSAFEDSLEQIQEQWIQLKPSQSFSLFKNSPPENADLTKAESATDEDFDKNQFADLSERLETAVTTSFVVTAALRASTPNLSFSEFTSYLRDFDSVFTNSLHSEALWTKNIYMEHFRDKQEFRWAAVRIAWVLRALGDFRSAISLVSQLKNQLFQQSKNEDLSFLYFILFPRPYEQSYSSIAAKCGIEINLLYALARQENFFNTKPTSMDRACTLRNLMQKYNGQLAYVLAAYDLGENITDSWIKSRSSIDTVTFVEWIPNKDTQNYVKSVIRNYAAYNWIYGGQ